LAVTLAERGTPARAIYAILLANRKILLYFLTVS